MAIFLRPSPFDDEHPRASRPPLFPRESGRGPRPFFRPGLFRVLRRAAAVAAPAAALAIVAALAVRGCRGCAAGPEPGGVPAAAGPDLFSPVREAPESFPRNARLPGPSERECSGAIDLDTFSAGRDLVYVTDGRCWWESDNDAAENDVECDHTMHAALEIPFRRLVNLVAKAEGTNSQLRVQEAYRPTGVHSARSLHCEGRAIDLTLGRPGAKESYRGAESAAALERLAKLCWQAGFDWVYFENGGTGPHVHASVRRAAPRLRPVPDGSLPQGAPESRPRRAPAVP